MKSNFFDIKFIKIIICSVLFISLFGFILNRLYINKFINDDDIIASNNNYVYKETADGLYTYYIFEENKAKEIFITKYNGDETNVIIPDKIDGIAVKKIGDSCFTLNDKIVTVEVPSTIVHIGTCAFAGCEKLQSITIPINVQTIEPYAFVDSDKITIYSHKNSAAFNYADEYNIKFETIKSNEQTEK